MSFFAWHGVFLGICHIRSNTRQIVKVESFWVALPCLVLPHLFPNHKTYSLTCADSRPVLGPCGPTLPQSEHTTALHVLRAPPSPPPPKSRLPGDSSESQSCPLAPHPLAAPPSLNHAYPPQNATLQPYLRLPPTTPPATCTYIRTFNYRQRKYRMAGCV